MASFVLLSLVLACDEDEFDVDDEVDEDVEPTTFDATDLFDDCDCDCDAEDEHEDEDDLDEARM